MSDRFVTELVEARPSEECGCPEEEWLVNSVTLTVHIEPEGYVHALLDAGDWDEETTFPEITDLDAGREAAFAWARPFVTGPPR